MPSPYRLRPARFDWVDLSAAMVVILASLWAASRSYAYGIGSARAMGAGFFPLALALLGVGLGLIIAARAVLRPRYEPRHIDLRRLLFVTAAFVIFAVAIRPCGLLPTVVMTAFVASLAHPDSKPHQSLMLGLGLAALVWAVFVLGLGQAIPLWPAL